ncbi:hypothetical protein NLG97_g7368 [Lecanicillium saksenae]|uniref:Uncharacterized protein n=1 Tax=Lecanicillium saksenae TaxID=468837 RepID=A0ACC1QM44_9HYPO|nr:hypothetical protein NLG97_g7368 [Lecanicillium saksenae]
MSDGVTNPHDPATGFAEDKGKGKAAERVHDDAQMEDDDEDDDEDEDEDDDDFEGENEGEDIEDGADEVDLNNIVEGGRRTRGAKIDFAKAAAENPADDDDDEDDDDFEPPVQDTEIEEDLREGDGALLTYFQNCQFFPQAHVYRSSVLPLLEHIPPFAWSELGSAYKITMSNTWRLYDSLGQLLPLLGNPETDSSSENERRIASITSLARDSDKIEWGITVIRVDYSAPQSQLLDALDCINDAVRRDLDAAHAANGARNKDTIYENTATEHGWPVRRRRGTVASAGERLFAAYDLHLLSHFYNLNQATTNTIRHEFRNWIVRKKGNTCGGDMRYVFCVILDTDTIHQLHQIWRQSFRVATAQQQMQLKVLDAVPGDECHGAYKVYLGGMHGLVNFWFARTMRRHSLEYFLKEPSDDGGMWCFGPPNPAPLPAEEVAKAEKPTNSKGKKVARGGGGWRGKKKRGGGS